VFNHIDEIINLWNLQQDEYDENYFIGRFVSDEFANRDFSRCNTDTNLRYCAEWYMGEGEEITINDDNKIIEFYSRY